MEDELPLPLPDRRTLNNNNSLKSSENNFGDEKNKFKKVVNSSEKTYNDLKESKASSVSMTASQYYLLCILLTSNLKRLYPHC